MIKTKRMVLGFVILFICVFMTTGCFKEETHTARGAKWYVEETAPTNKYVANVGDMYLDKETNNLYQMKEDGWLQVGNLSSKETPITPTVEISEDGYWIINGEKTEHKAIGKDGQNGKDGKDGVDGKDGKDGVDGTNGTDGKDGQNGTDGKTPSITIGENGHWYINGIDTGLSAIGKDGQDGTDGKDGATGTDGKGVYIGYNGYIWNGTEQTSYKVSKEQDEEIAENTIGIQDTMSLYFKNGYLDLKDKRVALMANYMPNAKLTQYSEITIKEITVYTKEAGKLSIGTAKVVDIVNARINGTTYNVNTTEYEVTKGLNTITLNIEVAEDETIVLGGNNSVGLFYAKGINVDDEQGVFTYIDNEKHDYIISSTNDIKDKLAISVKVNLYSKEKTIFNDIKTELSNLTTASSYTKTSNPFTYQNTNYFSGKKITKIGIPVKTVSAIDENQFFTIYVLDKKSIVKSGKATSNREFKIYLAKEELGTNTTVDKWIDVDVTKYNIELNENETLGFYSDEDTVTPGYSRTGNNSLYKFHANILTNVTEVSAAENIYWDIYYKERISLDERIESLKQKEELAKSTVATTVETTTPLIVNSKLKASDITETARLANNVVEAENPNTSTSLLKIVTIIVAVIACTLIYKASNLIKVNKYNE